MEEEPYHTKYYNLNKEKLKEYYKDYYTKNKQKYKDHYETNKQKLQLKYLEKKHAGTLNRKTSYELKQERLNARIILFKEQLRKDGLIN